MEKTEAFGPSSARQQLDATGALDGTGKDDFGQTEPQGGTTRPGMGDTEAADLAPVISKPKPAPRELQRVGEFTIIKKLGQGGMGAVYKARQEALDRDVALKVMASHLAENKPFVDRFYREARIQAKLDHPHIVRCYHVGEHEGTPYLALEFVDGGSVGDYLKKLGRLKVGDALHVILACAYALQHAHEQHMIHRDIKPDNLLINSKGVVKLADLGLAKAIDDDLSLTQSGTGAGTPYYMSPEQTRNAKHVDVRTDIYAMGVMLYVLLTGEMPFQGTTTVELLQSKEQGRFPPVRKKVVEVPERLDLMIDKMLAKNLDHRYQSCAEMIKDLESLGLASQTLSFVKTAALAGGVKIMGAASQSHAQPREQPANQQAASGEQIVEGVWYVKMKTQGPKMIVKKLTTEAIIGMIRSKELDNTFDASKTVKGTYRALATYREFEPFLRGKIQQERVQRKAQKYEGMYEKIIKEEASYQRWKGMRRFINNLGGWVKLLVFLGILGGGGFAVYLYWDQIKGLIGM
jgi:serine/threonine-protein kinase